MALWFKPQISGDPSLLESREQQISLVMSLAAVLFMVLGLLGFFFSGSPWIIPGIPATSLVPLIQPRSFGLPAMSLGILILGVLPIGRVALAMWFYGRQGNVGEAMVALVVLLELCLSLFWGSH